MRFSRVRRDKGLGLVLLLFLAQCRGSVCRWTRGVNQNPITAEVIDARLQVSRVSAGIPARIKKNIHVSCPPYIEQKFNLSIIIFNQSNTF